MFLEANGECCQHATVGIDSFFTVPPPPSPTVVMVVERKRSMQAVASSSSKIASGFGKERGRRIRLLYQQPNCRYR